MKKIISMLLICLMVFSMAGCSKKANTNESSSLEQSTAQNNSEAATDNTENSSQNNSTLNLQALSEMMTSDEALGFGMTFPTEADILTEMIGLNSSTLSQYSFSDAVMVQSNTLYLAQANSSSQVDGIKTAFEKRLAQIQQSFEHYLPDPYELSLKGKVVTNGNYVMLVICEDVEKAIEVFNNAVETQFPTEAELSVKLNYGDLQSFVEYVKNDESIDFGMSFDQDSSFVAEALELDLNKLNQYRFVDPGRANSDTLYVAEVISSEDVEAVRAAFEKQLLKVQKNFERYLEEEYKTALNGQVVVNGNYVMLIITPNSNQVIELFNSITQ